MKQGIFPRWRGFNLLGMFCSESSEYRDFRSPGYYTEEDFKMISDWGFDFVRLPLSYRIWSDVSDPYKIDEGKIIFDGRDITNENATSRALMGIFTGTQNVPEIPGLTITSFLKHSASAHHHFESGRDLPMSEFIERLESGKNIPLITHYIFYANL